jgi:hypothetical protein
LLVGFHRVDVSGIGAAGDQQLWRAHAQSLAQLGHLRTGRPLESRAMCTTIHW